MDNKGNYPHITEGENNMIVIGNNEELIFLENGNIYIRGKLVEEDKHVVEGLRHFLKNIGYMN